MTATLAPSEAPLLLGSHAAGSCPVKTHHAHDPTAAGRLHPAAAAPDPAVAEFLERRAEFEASVLRRITELNSSVADLRAGGTEADCLAALRAGVDVVLSGRLPADPTGHRVGRPPVLLRDPSVDRPAYHPALVTWHKIVEPVRRPLGADEPPPSVAYTTLSAPGRAEAHELPGHVLRRARNADFLQLAHYHRMLAAAGFAADPAWGAVLSSDTVFAEPVLFWCDLARPTVRTSAPEEPEGWRLASALERYDEEHAFRLAVAEVARRQTGEPDDPAPLVDPVVIAECRQCPWWTRCRPQLDADDISLRIGKGALDRREIGALRQRGIRTITDLAGADLDDLLVDYLPAVAHRSGPEARLRAAAKRAHMLLAKVDVVRETTGRIELARAEVEVDFDIETSADGRIYLWGFAVTTGDGSTTYREFSCFDDLDPPREAALARAALDWLQKLVHSGATVFHYSGYEVARITELADREDDPLLRWAATYAGEHFVDLFETVRTHFFGASGLGLKQIAQHAGFRWRDEDPGGLNSQRWFADAVHNADPAARAQARRRVLDYNEDDVRATLHLRRWLRAQD